MYINTNWLLRLLWPRSKNSHIYLLTTICVCGFVCPSGLSRFSKSDTLDPIQMKLYLINVPALNITTLLWLIVQLSSLNGVWRSPLASAGSLAFAFGRVAPVKASRSYKDSCILMHVLLALKIELYNNCTTSWIMAWSKYDFFFCENKKMCSSFYHEAQSLAKNQCQARLMK